MSGKSDGLAIGIRVVDEATAKIDALNKRLQTLGAPAERFNKSMAKFGQVSGITQTAESIKGMGDSALGSARALERMVSPLALLTSGASIAGIAELSRRWAETNANIGKVAYTLDAPVERLSELDGAAKLANVSVDSLHSGLGGLSKTLLDVATGKGGESKTLLEHMGIDAGTPGHVTKVVDTLAPLADYIQKFRGQPTVQLHALEVLGLPADMLPMLKDGRRGLEAFIAEARKTGDVDIGGKWAKDAAELNKSWTGLGMALDGVSSRLIDKYEPAVKRILDETQTWIEKNPKLAESIGEVASAAGLAISGLILSKPALWVLRAMGWEPLAVATVAELANQLPPADLQSGKNTVTPLTMGGFTVPPPAGTQLNLSSDEYHPGFFESLGNWFREHNWRGSGSAVRGPGPRSGGGTPGPVGTTADRSLSLEERTLGDALSGGESTGNYDKRNTESTAYGRYQFLNATRDGLLRQMGLPIGTPLTNDLQDRMMVLDARNRGWREGMTPEQSSATLNQEWPSLPGGSQENTSALTWSQRLTNARATETARDIADAAPAAGAPGASGHVQVDIHIKGAPHGTTAAATGTGAVMASPPRVETSMSGGP